MTRIGWFGLLCLVSFALIPAMTLASQPDPINCSWDACLGRSPKNSTADPSAQYSYQGTLRDNQGAPWPNFPWQQIELIIDAPCANPVTLHPDGPSDPNGSVTWGPGTLNQGGGACLGTQVVTVRVNAQPFATLDNVRSPDGNGDGLIALSDLQAWQVAFVQQTPLYVGDLDCDGYIALSDLSLWQKHFVAP